MDAIIELIQRYKRGVDETDREAAADQLLSKIYPPLMMFVRTRVAKENVEDVVQNSLRDIFERLWLFEGKTSEAFWAWFYRIARCRCADSFRGRKVSLATIVDPELLRNMLELVADASLTAAQQADLQAAVKLLEKSAPPCLDWLWDRYVVGLSFVELGAQEGVTEEAARKRVTRCLKLARELLGE